MEFKSHPYYDGSEANDWLSFDWPELATHVFKELNPQNGERVLQQLRDDKPRLCELALKSANAARDQSDRVERPHPFVNDYLFHPIGEQGYRVYIECYFFQEPDKPSPDTDSWWVIIHNTYAIPPFPPGPNADRVMALGWLIH